MIKKSFVILPRFSINSEKKLWDNGVHSWDHFLQNSNIPGISPQQKSSCDEFLTKAKRNLEVKNHDFFYHNLPKDEHWRLYQEFKEHLGFVDIETTGLSKHYNKITTISFWDGKEARTYINGDNLTEENMIKEFEKHKVLISFNGNTFDLPFIKEKFPSLNLDKPHIDLRWVGYRLGLKGGLKKIEKDLDIDRGSELADVDGYAAVKLWHSWEKRGNKDALDLLVRYNQEDVINLEKLGNLMYNRLSQKV